MAEILWRSRKRNSMGWACTFTVYELYADRMIIRTGLFNQTEDEIRLFRITDITLKTTLWQRMLGMGNLHICSNDASKPELDLVNIKNPKNVRQQLSDLVDADRKDKRAYFQAENSDCKQDNIGPGMPPRHEH